MDIPVRIAGMEGQNLTLRPAGLAGPKLILNGQAVNKQNGAFNVRSNTGSTLAVKFKPRFLDPVPDLVVGGQTITIMPPLQWYQYALMAVPMLLVFAGGAIGGFFGGMGAFLSSRVFRSDMNNGTKYALSGLISLGAFISYFIVAATVLSVVKR